MSQCTKPLTALVTSQLLNYAIAGACSFVSHTPVTSVMPRSVCAGEDLRRIQQGGWVGWKRPGESAAAGGPLFVADAFYNFLCPQRPKVAV